MIFIRHSTLDAVLLAAIRLVCASLFLYALARVRGQVVSGEPGAAESR